MSREEILDDRTRAEDILLGSLGFGEDARIRSVRRTPSGYAGTGVFSDGEEFTFDSAEGLDELQEWALGVLGKDGESRSAPGSKVA